jgi:hypothetical protein
LLASKTKNCSWVGAQFALTLEVGASSFLPAYCGIRQFDDVRRNTKFMAAKIVPNTRRRGITPGPKLAASPTIQSRMASVKIVQNTALLLNGRSCQKKLTVRFTVVWPRETLSVMGFDFGSTLSSIVPTLLIQIKRRRLFVP